MTYYLAAPFFNDKQKQRIRRVVDILKNYEHKAYLPMDFMVLKPDATKEQKRKVFHENVRQIARADRMLAIQDEKDTGTIWEMGAAYMHGIEVVMVYVDPVPQINVMLEMGSYVCCNGIFILENWLRTGTIPETHHTTQ